MKRREIVVLLDGVLYLAAWSILGNSRLGRHAASRLDTQSTRGVWYRDMSKEDKWLEVAYTNWI